MITEVLEALARKAQADVVRQAKAKEIDATKIISYEALFRPWVPGKYEVDDVRTKDGQVWRCCQEHDNASNPDIVPGTHPAQWAPYHSRSKRWAKSFVHPTGAHDIYKEGEYMIYTDGKTYMSKMDTDFSPDEYGSAWEQVE